MPLTYQDYLDFNYCVICRFCQAKVLDPDKAKGQKHLNCRCPVCGKDPHDSKKSKFWGKNQ